MTRLAQTCQEAMTWVDALGLAGFAISVFGGIALVIWTLTR